MPANKRKRDKAKSAENRAPPAESQPASTEAPASTAQGAPFPIVGIGASAGGLEAFTRMLHALPADTGMAFVMVQHLAPAHPSALADILSRSTSMPVLEVHDQPTVLPNHVYIIPPNRNIIIAGGKLQLLQRELHGQQRAIDIFLRSLAQEQGYKSIGIILSGSASDGTLGLQEVKAAGGITFAQDDSAQHGSMPRSAIASGCVDFELSPEQIAQEIARIAHHPYIGPLPKAKLPELVVEPDLTSILKILRKVTGVDFTHYKSSTLFRRITRRMLLHKLDELAEYVELLQNNPGEVEALYQDILISVTSFFRDPDAFEVLKTKVLPELIKDRSRHQPLRLWVLGCSTGEEAYSLVEKVRADPIFQKAMVEVPVRFGMVELDRIVICQKLVSRAHIDRLKQQLGAKPTPEEVFQFCIPSEHGRMPVRAGRIGDEEFAFISESNDLRFLEAVLLRPEQITGYQAEGPLVGILGLVVGYSPNYLSLLEVNGRLLLHNGNHRACTLRDLGLAHAPCIIQQISNDDELEMLAPAPIRRNPDYYLKQARPPVLKDYFDAALTRLVRVALTSREVRIRYSVEERDTP